MKHTLIIFVFLIAIPVWAGTFRDDFEDGDYEGWKVALGKWEVNNGVLITKNDADFTVIDLGEETWRDYTIEFDGKVKSHQGNYCIAGSVRSQQKDPKKGWAYYCIAANTGFGERIEASVYIDLNQYFGMTRIFDFALELDKWYKFKATINEGKFNYYLDDKLVISTDWTDQPLSPNGIVELWTRYPGEYWFDNVVITGSDIPNTGPSGFNSPFSVKSGNKLAITWGNIKK